MWLCRWGGEGKVRYESCNDKRRESKRLKMYQMNEREEKGEEGKKGAETKKVNSPIPAWATDVFIGYEEQ